MANQIDWAAKSQVWSSTLTSIYKSFPKLPEGLAEDKVEAEQQIIDSFIQSFFTRKGEDKEKCAGIYRELIAFVEPLVQATDHPLFRFKEPQGEDQKMVSFLDMVAKVKCIARADLSAFTADPIFEGCNRITYSEESIPLPEAVALPQTADPVDWMDKSLARHVVMIVRAAAEPAPDQKTIEHCRAIFNNVKTYMQQLRNFYSLPALEQWSFYDACIAIFPYVAQDEVWPQKIERLALARLSSDELKKMKTPGTTPTKKLAQTSSALSTPTKERLQASSAKLQMMFAAGTVKEDAPQLELALAASTSQPPARAPQTRLTAALPANAPAASVSPSAPQAHQASAGQPQVQHQAAASVPAAPAAQQPLPQKSATPIVSAAPAYQPPVSQSLPYGSERVKGEPAKAEAANATTPLLQGKKEKTPENDCCNLI
ncbi:MAG: hypothetical protein LLG04_16840 [Parachlamydia sp.]|nr:hypothetical protein [Parachlamydia sp.]